MEPTLSDQIRVMLLLSYICFIVICSAILSSYLLNEKLNLHGKVGCFLCILGSTVLVIHAPQEENVSNMLELSLKLKDPGFISYAVLVVGLSVLLVFKFAKKYGKQIVFIYIAICSLIGSLTVMACKGLGIVLKSTFSGTNELTNPVSWMLLISGLFCIMTQMNYLNKALDIFNIAIVTPIYYVMFTTCTIIASAILFKEWENLNTKDMLGALCGFLTIIVGVFLLHAFKDVKFSLKDLYNIVSRTESQRPLNDGAEAVLMSSIKDEDEEDYSDEGSKYTHVNQLNHIVEEDRRNGNF